jgi:hypothetical protein
MTNQTSSLLGEVLDAHGGYDRWREFTGVASTIVSGGRLWEIKGARITRTPRRATSEFRRQWTRVTPFGNPDWTMTWEPRHIEITDGKGTIVAQRDNGRDTVDRSYDAHWDPLRGLAVRLPETIHSHCREQRFYFGSDRLLRRHDYDVDVWADTPAAHFLSEYMDVGGLKFPCRRSVYFRRPDGQPDRDFNLVYIDLSEYKLF